MKIIAKTILLLMISAIVFLSCDKMEDIHADYIKDGEIIYANIPDSLESFCGKNRILLKWYVHKGRNIEKSVIEWEDDEEMKRQEIDVSLNSPVDSVQVLIENLDEKGYLFHVYNVDKYGNKSVIRQITGEAFGDNYMASLVNRPAVIGGGGIRPVIISFGTIFEGYVGAEIIYNDDMGKKVSKMITKDDEAQLVIEDWEGESELSYRSFYQPPNCIDTFVTPMDHLELPVLIPPEYKLDNDLMSPVFLPGDADLSGYGGGIHKLFNGIIDPNNYAHSPGELSQPPYFTIDLGVTVKLGALLVHQRINNASDYCGGHNAQDFEIWGMSEEPPADGSWDDWVHLETFIGVRDPLVAANPLNLYEGDVYTFSRGHPEVRYIRILVNSVWGNTDKLMFTQLGFYEMPPK